MTDIDLDYYRGLSADHEPHGWPGIRMREITALCDEIESLRAKLKDMTDRSSRMERDLDITQSQCHTLIADNADLQAQLEAMSAQCGRLREVGGPMSNVCYNVAQWGATPKDTASMLKDLAHKWDKAARIRQQAKEKSV